MATEGRIYVVDDDDAVRDSLVFQLEVAGYEVRSFGSGTEFLAVAPRLAEGCLILDVRMPELDGLELQERLRRMSINFPTIMITGHGDVPLAVRAMRGGAVDFVEKPFSEEAILASLHLAQTHLEPRAPGGDGGIAADRLKRLSPREREVLEGIVEGLPNKLIAFELGLSPRTVEVHRARVMDKMQARSLSELIRSALEAGVRTRS